MAKTFGKAENKQKPKTNAKPKAKNSHKNNIKNTVNNPLFCPNMYGIYFTTKITVAHACFVIYYISICYRGGGNFFYNIRT